MNENVLADADRQMDVTLVCLLSTVVRLRNVTALTTTIDVNTAV